MPLQPPAGTASSITIQTPAVPQELATARVPVQASPTTVAYIKGAVWVEAPAQAFGRMLGDTITARTGRVVLRQGDRLLLVDQRDVCFASIEEGRFSVPTKVMERGCAQLTGELRGFGIDAASRSAVVVYDASLVRATGGGIVKQRFEARVPVATIDATGAGVGLNAAANQVAAQVADWVRG